MAWFGYWGVHGVAKGWVWKFAMDLVHGVLMMFKFDFPETARV